MRRIKTGDLRNVFGEKFVLGVMTGAVVDSVSLSVVGAAGMWLGVSAAILLPVYACVSQAMFKKTYVCRKAVGRAFFPDDVQSAFKSVSERVFGDIRSAIVVWEENQNPPTMKTIGVTDRERSDFLRKSYREGLDRSFVLPGLVRAVHALVR